MIRNISYRDKELNLEINELVGKSYGVFSIFKLGGIGSPRLRITDASPELKAFLPKIEHGEFCNIELRPKGVIIRFRYHLDVMGWIIPYHKLSVIKPDDGYSLHADGNYINFSGANSNTNPSKFVSKLMEQKQIALSDQMPI